jgi:hypothetical protein
MKRINLYFYYQRIYRRTKNYRRKIHRWSISVSDSVCKLITDGICVLRRQKSSVGKTVKSCIVHITQSHLFFSCALSNRGISAVYMLISLLKKWVFFSKIIVDLLSTKMSMLFSWHMCIISKILFNYTQI